MNVLRLKYLVFPLLLWIAAACGEKTPAAETLFEELSADYTRVTFANQVESTPEMNIFSYRNFYNGGGVAIGDLNQDGLPDLYLTANTAKNQLYLNQGNLQFKDITATAGVGGNQAWSTGVTMADVNGDGLLDIYVCNAGEVSGDNRKNELFINNGLGPGGIPTFTEKAAAYGLDDEGYSTHAAFFDYDRDGDLDVYLLNNSSYPVSRLGYNNIRNERDPLGGDKLLRNDNGRFTDVSAAAGIYGSLIGFGLGITIGDVNDDNWPDVFISNDFFERDYLYLNHRDGTFREVSQDWMQHESLSSMGADIADINNDGSLDIFVTDMLPGDDVRLKKTSQFEGYDLAQLKLSRDFHHQYMQNMLHLNNGNNSFSEVARLAGVHATDWSWGALLFDMDNDGLKDIFVANGIYKDLTDQDFVNFLGAEETMRRAVETGGGYNYNQELIAKMSSSPIPNYAFRNAGNLQFENQAGQWGLGKPGFSNGAAYGDLDNDGDLDLVVNNLNNPVSIYKNKSTEMLKHHFLRVKLKGPEKNRHGVGAKVYVYQSGKAFFQQQMPNRGFESSVDLTLVFGLGKKAGIDSLRVVWPDDKSQTIAPLKADGEVVCRYEDAVPGRPVKPRPEREIFQTTAPGPRIAYTHQESNFVDYNRDALLKQMLSTQGPALATGDVNGDGLEDVFLGGAAGTAKKLFLQQRNGTFAEKTPAAFRADDAYEDVDAAFFDADNDQDLDLYVVTGSNEFLPGAAELLDRFYLNDGKGNFSRDNRLPNLAENGSCVAPADFDQDGDIDLFIGSRMVSGSYGIDPPSFLYINDGSGSFKNYTKRYLPRNELGMITDAIWQDTDGDRYPELILVGDWMPVRIFKNQQGRRLQETKGLPDHSAGWWSRIKAADIDGDGDMDFILGNQGSNTRIKGSRQQPAALVAGDFDRNGTVEQVISCYAEDGKSYPMVLKHELQKQVPAIKKKFVKFSDYAGKSITEIFSPEELQGAVHKSVTQSNTCFLVNQGQGKFRLQPLPVEAQMAPVYGIEVLDYNHDQVPDLLLTGNFYDVLPELGRYDANAGVLLEGQGKGKYLVRQRRETGLHITGQVRRSRMIRDAQGKAYIVLAKNNGPVQVLNCP